MGVCDDLGQLCRQGLQQPWGLFAVHISCHDLQAPQAASHCGEVHTQEHVAARTADAVGQVSPSVVGAADMQEAKLGRLLPSLLERSSSWQVWGTTDVTAMHNELHMHLPVQMVPATQGYLA